MQKRFAERERERDTWEDTLIESNYRTLQIYKTLSTALPPLVVGSFYFDVVRDALHHLQLPPFLSFSSSSQYEHVLFLLRLHVLTVVYILDSFHPFRD